MQDLTTATTTSRHRYSVLLTFASQLLFSKHVQFALNEAFLCKQKWEKSKEGFLLTLQLIISALVTQFFYL